MPLGLAGGAEASDLSAPVNIADAYRGYWQENGTYCASLPLAGDGAQSDECRLAFAFPLFGIETPVTSARLQLHLEWHISEVAAECLDVHPLDDPQPLFSALDSIDAFVDAGSGPVYGSVCFSVEDEGQTKELVLSAAAVQRINDEAAPGGSGYFTVGARLTTLDGSFGPTNEEGLRFGLGNPVPWLNELIVESAPGEPEIICNDTIDNDSDGDTDCADTDCQGVSGCGEIV